MKSGDTILWQRFAAIVMVIPAGFAPALYMSMVGFYALNFQSSVYFIAMLFAMYLPYPILPLVQHKVDGFFDERFSTKTAYFFRVVCAQLILGFIGIIWMLVPQSPATVLVIGTAIGIMASANISSCHQLCAAMAPQLPQFAMVGEQIGATLPITTFALLAFDAESSLHVFMTALSFLPASCILAAAVLSYAHFETDLFEEAYVRLAYRDDSEALNNYISEQGCLSPGRQTSILSNLISEQGVPSDHCISPLGVSSDDGEDPDGVPPWVWYWMVAGGFMAAVEGFMLSLMPFFGDPSMAQQLALMKLAMHFVGKISAIPISTFACFQHGPLHKVMGSFVVGYLVLALVLAAKLAKFNMHMPMFLLAWCLFNGWYRFIGSFSIVTMLSYVMVQDRKLVARSNLIASLGFVLVGVVLALTVVYFSDGLNGAWPRMGKVIS